MEQGSGEIRKMKKEVYLTQQQKRQQGIVIQKLNAAKTKQPITSLPFKQIAFKAFDSREKKENYYYIEFQNRRRWEGHLFHEQQILRKSDQIYFKTILMAIKDFEANFCEKQNQITCKNIRRCLRIHLHRVQRLKIPTYEEIYKELGLCIWVTSPSRKRIKKIEKVEQSLAESSSYEEESNDVKSDEQPECIFANLGKMKDLVFKDAWGKENSLERSPLIDKCVKKMDQDYDKMEKIMLSKQEKEPREEEKWGVQVKGVFKTRQSEKVMVVQEERDGSQRVKEWNNMSEPQLNRALMDFLLENSNVPSFAKGATISF